MIFATTAASVPRVSTRRQRSLRQRSRKLSLKNAVRNAVDVYFRFESRAVQGKALWSDAERVWLGRETFLHWSLCLEDINIPWVVATAGEAPSDAEKLHLAVRAELMSYWADCLGALPRRTLPHWLPLP
jgi:hypothetical protein